EGDDIFTLNGTPSGGAWVGMGVSGDQFDPTFGSQLIRYIYTDPLTGCTDSADVMINVVSLPVGTAGSYGPFCTSDPPVMLNGTPAGGVWSGPGVSGDQFDPAVAGEGQHELTYTYTDGNGCIAAETTIIEVEICCVAPSDIIAPATCLSDGSIVLSRWAARLVAYGV